MHKAQYMLHVWHTRVAFMLAWCRVWHAKTALYTKHSVRIEKKRDEKNTKVMRMTERKKGNDEFIGTKVHQVTEHPLLLLSRTLRDETF